MRGIDTSPRISVSESALLSNLHLLRTRVSAETLLAPVIKANAWGHGRDLVARILAPHVDVLAVATANDALAVSRLSDTPVLCLGPASGSQLRELLDAGVQVTVSDKAAARECATGDRVHVLVDTGLHRLGARPSDAVTVLDAVRNAGAEIAGLFCHVAGADRGDWHNVEAEVAALRRLAAGTPIHTGGSSLIIERPDLVGDIARPGIALYGFQPSSRQVGLIELTPALSLSAPVVEIRDLPAGSQIGYSAATLKRQTTLATLPVGVAHGLDPRLAEAGGSVEIRGRSCAILAPPMLDYLLVDATEVPGTSVGDAALVMGGPSDTPFSISSVARRLQTTPEHVLARLSDSIRRERTA